MNTQMNLAESDVIRGLQIFARGEDVKHHNGDFTVDDRFVAEFLESYEKITAAGFRVPILVEHQSNGKIYGQVLSVYADSEGIYIDVEFAQGIKEEWERGERGNLSPSVWREREHPHTGEVLPNLLREVSMVSVPHLKNLKQPQFHYSLNDSGFLTAEPAKETAMADDNKPDSPANEPTENMDGEEWDMAEFASRLEAMEKSVAKLEEMIPKEEMSDDDEETEMSELKRDMAALKLENARLKVSGDLGLTGDHLTKMAETLVKDPELYEFNAQVIRKAATKDVEIGSVGSAARTGGPSNFAEAKKLAEKEGIEPGKQRLRWVEDNYPNALPRQ